MAITISGENNNDRILAADGVIDQISGINFSGIITASHINVGSNIQLGNAGIVTATTFIGDVTGNINSTSNLLLQISGSERFRVGNNGQWGIGGANYGTSGQVFTSGGSGGAPSWTTIPTQVTISNNADDRVITGGSGVNLNGEQRLTFNSSNILTATETGTGNGMGAIRSATANAGGNAGYGFMTNGANRFAITTIGSEGSESLRIYDDNNNSERFRIDSSGNVGIDETGTILGKLHVVGGRASGTAYNAAVFAGGQNSTSGSGVKLYLSGCENSPIDRGVILESIMTNNSNAHRFSILVSGSSATPTERLRIDSNGRLTVGSSLVATSNGIAEFHRDIGGGAEGCHILVKNTSTNSVNNTARLKLETSGGTAQFYAFATAVTELRSRVGGTADWKIRADGASNTRFFTNDQERVRIDSNGNFMVGRTSASKKFSVREGSTSSGVYYPAQIGGSNHVSGYAVGIAFDPEGYAARTKMALVAEGTGQGYSRGKFHFLLDAANDSGEATLSESRMTITDAGNVGINANSPNTQLVVRAPGGSGHASAQVHSGDGNTIINMQTVQGTEGRFGMNTNHPLCFYTNGLQHLKMTTTGALQQTASSGVSYFKGSSEYVFGSNTSSPGSGGPEGKFQVHDAKTRVTLSLNAYMNNAGAPMLQFLSSRSGTVGTLGTKSALNDYHGDIRFMGDNGTNYNSLVNSAQILVRQKSTISDGDTVCAGEMTFYTGSDTGGSILQRVSIDQNGRLTLSNSEGIVLSAKNSSLFALDGTLSYYATNNGVYLNGAGANGWLRLNASGVSNDRTAINLIGHSAGGGDTIRFRTNSIERLRIKNDGLISIANPSGSGTGALTIYPNSITGNGRLDVYGGGDENNQNASRNEVMRIGRGDILDSYYHSIWSATGSGAATSHFLKFYVSNGTAGATNQVEALSMNGVGQVSMPSQPSFLAEHTHASGNHKQKGELINQFIRNFQHVRHNTGNCYSNSTGKFTAPSDGIYLFHIDFTMDGGDGNDDSAGCYFRVENNSANYNRVHSTNRDFHSVDPRLHSTSTGYEVNASFQTIEKLAAGATVGWYFTDWDYTGTRITTCFFSGYKVG